MQPKRHHIYSPSNTPLVKFSKWFPDSINYLVRWSEHLRCTKVSDLAKKLKYKGPLHLLSMYACLYTDSSFLCRDAKEYKKKGVLKTIKKHRRLNKNWKGHEGHPAAVCEDAFEEIDG